MMSPSRDFESRASTNSAIPAYAHYLFVEKTAGAIITENP